MVYHEKASRKVDEAEVNDTMVRSDRLASVTVMSVFFLISPTVFDPR